MTFDELNSKILNLLTKPEFKQRDAFKTNKSLELGFKFLKARALLEKPVSYFQASEEEEASTFNYPLFHGNGNKSFNVTYEDYYQKLNPNYESFNVTDKNCVDKTTLMNWLKYKCALFGFQPVIIS
jgi:hypothetical protein